MQAMISGSAKLAALIIGDEVSLINYEGKEIYNTKYSDAARQFYSYDDTIFLLNVSEDIALQKLQTESKKSDALLMLLSILDIEINEEIKQNLIKYTDNLLKEPLILNYIRGVLFSRPLTDDAITKIPLSSQKTSTTLNLINELINTQARIKRLYETWKNVANKFALSEENIKKLEGTFVLHQVGYKLSQAEITNAEYSALKFECLILLKDIKNARQIINSLFKSVIEIVTDSEKVFWPKITDETKSFEKIVSLKQGSRETTHQKYEQIKSQIKKIENYLFNNNQSQALKLESELVEQQTLRNENSYAAMTLCQLSEIAKNINNYSLQLHWAKKAIEIDPTDSRCYGHIADAYLNLENYEKAREYFEKSIKFGNKFYGKSGLARIERERFNFEKALNLIEDVINDETNIINNFALKAELYRELGRFGEAIELYKQLILDFPESARPICGLAATYANQKLFEEAENEYRKAINLYPNEQVPLSGLGFILARQGRFSEAFRYLDKGIKKAKKGDPIPVLSKAKALVLKGQYSKAEIIYKKIIERYPFSLDPKINLIESYIHNKKHGEALKVLNLTKEFFANNNKVLFSEAMLYKSQSKLMETLKMLDLIKSEYPRWIKALTERANILKRLENYSESRKQYEEVLNLNPHSRRARIGLKILDTLMRKNQEKILKSFEEISYKPITIEDWENINIQGLILLSLNQPIAAKQLLLHGFKKNPFKVIKENFAISLATSRVILGQYSTAIKTIKNVSSDIGLIQKTIILGEQGKTSKVKETLSKLPDNQTDTKNVISLVSKRYLSSDETDIPTVNEVMEEQLKTMLLAA